MNCKIINKFLKNEEGVNRRKYRKKTKREKKIKCWRKEDSTHRVLYVFAIKSALNEIVSHWCTCYSPVFLLGLKSSEDDLCVLQWVSSGQAIWKYESQVPFSLKQNGVFHPILHVLVLRIAFTCVHVFINNRNTNFWNSVH